MINLNSKKTYFMESQSLVFFIYKPINYRFRDIDITSSSPYKKKRFRQN